MTPLGLGLPNLATMLFNCPIRGIIAIISRAPVGINNDEEHYESLVNRQTRGDKNQGTPKNHISILTGSTIVFQCQDEGPWTHGAIEGKGDYNHHERSYNIHITRTGGMGTRDRKHIKPTQITAGLYLWDQLQKSHNNQSTRRHPKTVQKPNTHRHYTHYKKWTMYKYHNSHGQNTK